MRLSERIRQMILHAAEESFGEVDVYLFGSRVDDEKRGGDIDLAIDTDLPRELFRKKKARFLANLIRAGFEMKVDVVSLHTPDELLREQIRSHGVRL